MEKVHITLVGGQPVPVYVGIKYDTQADSIIYVCSAQSQEEAKRISLQFTGREQSFETCSPVNLKEIETLAETLAEKYAGWEKTINLTGGTKLWSLVFFKTFHQQEHTRFIYVDQTNVVTDILTQSAVTLPIDTLKRFELYGTPIASFVPYSEYTQEDFRVMRDIEGLRNVNRKDFTELTRNPDIEDLKKSGIPHLTEGGSYIDYSFEKSTAEVCLVGYSGYPQKRTWHSEHLFEILFNSGWFELMTAQALSQNPNIRNIWLNCKFSGATKMPKNEIDIIAELGNRLLFVECKTMIHDTTDIDKFRSALRNFSGTSTTGLFVTHDAPTKRTTGLYNHAMEKCKDNNILTYNFKLWREHATSLPTLSELINSQISQQNTR